MDFLINVGLPVSLAIIMLSLGIGLEIADFRRVLTRKYPFAIGALCQVVLLPIAAFATVKLLGLPPEIAVGFMLLSFCPGGVTSNILDEICQGRCGAFGQPYRGDQYTVDPDCADPSRLDHRAFHG